MSTERTESTKESVAFNLLCLIYNKDPNANSDKDWFLNTYAECLTIVSEPWKRFES
jgi:hypothetical protein